MPSILHRHYMTHFQTIKHENIACFYQVIETPGQLCLLMEYVPGGELFQHVSSRQHLSEVETREIMHQLCLGIRICFITYVAIEYLHASNIVHRDLKLENIIIDTNNKGEGLHIKLVDFGLARFSEAAALLTTRCGSEEYAAPEIIRADMYDGRASDVWSLGIILYACLIGVLPFNPDPKRPRALFKHICAAKYTIPPGTISPEAECLIKQILVSNPKERLTLAELQASLWMNSP